MKKRLCSSWAKRSCCTAHTYAGPCWSNPRLELARLFCQDRARDSTGMQRARSVPQRSLSPHPSHLEACPVPSFVPCILKNTAAQAPSCTLPFPAWSQHPPPAASSGHATICTSFPTHLSLLLSLPGRSSEDRQLQAGMVESSFCSRASSLNSPSSSVLWFSHLHKLRVITITKPQCRQVSSSTEVVGINNKLALSSAWRS